MAEISVKKYQDFVDLPAECFNGINIRNVTHFDDCTYVATSSKYNPIVKFNTDKNCSLLENPTLVYGFSKTKIKFIGFIKNKLAAIPDKKWNISVLNNDEEESYNNLSINGSTDLKYKLVEKIRQKYGHSCRNEKCYHLIGFIDLHKLYIFVQLCCKHDHKNNSLYILRMDCDILTCNCTNVEVVNEYNFYRLCVDKNINERLARLIKFTGLHYEGERICLVSKHDNKYFIWELPYFANISYIGPPVIVCKMRHNPVGCYFQDKTLIVLCDYICDNQLGYYKIIY